MWQQIKEIYLYREMLRNLVSKELRARYKGSVLGFFWTFANPLLMLIVYSVVFSFVMRIQVENYAMFLFVALLPWNYLAQSTVQSAASLVQNHGLIKKIYFPRAVLPLSIVFANLTNYALGLFVLVPALLFFHIKLTPALLAFPAIVVLQTLLVVSVGLLIAVATVYFRDLEHITNILITVWFFLTPVLYPADLVPERFRSAYLLNPAAVLVDSYRAIFFYGRWPDWNSLAQLAPVLLALLLISFVIFERLQRAVAEEI
ncbi:MAG: ABC transporter permease [Bacillota bacterium]